MGAAPTEQNTLSPTTSLTYVVGDIHGRLDLLQKIDEAIANDSQRLKIENPATVYVGDYIDRGPESAACLHWLYEQAQTPNTRAIHLLGNHEEMFLGFVDGDLATARSWLMNGGRETLLSFGITPAHRLRSDSDLESLREAALQKLPKTIIRWLRTLPRVHQIGNLIVTHAALDPKLSLDNQDEKILTWGHPKFLTMQRCDDLWVVHGHTITRPASIIGRRVAIDTGAYRSGELTAAVFCPDQPIRFLSVQSGEARKGG